MFKNPGVSWKKTPGFRGLKISQKPRVSGIGGNRGNNPSKQNLIERLESFVYFSKCGDEGSRLCNSDPLLSGEGSSWEDPLYRQMEIKDLKILLNDLWK